MAEEKYPLKELTHKIIGCALEVHSTLGPGLLESVYENALAREFEIQQIGYKQQMPIPLSYKGHMVGEHRLDFLVENSVVLELKCVENLHPVYDAQILTYLKATDCKIGLLINFKVERLKSGIKRIIL